VNDRLVVTKARRGEGRGGYCGCREDAGLWGAV